MPGISSAEARSVVAATRTQNIVERLLFALFGGMLALGAFALYATGTAAHNAVPQRFDTGLAEDRVNVLVITTERRPRVGRLTAAAASLTLLSVRPSSGDAVLIGLPLHLWSDLGTQGARPLGAAFEVGNASGSPGGGDGLTIEAVERLTGLAVHGFVRVSSEDLARLIDRKGGVRVAVARGVYESRHQERYPRGVQRLDGRRATLYAFSPDMTGFARDAALRHERAQSVLASALPRLLASDPGVASNLDADQLTKLRQVVSSTPVRRVDVTHHLVRTRRKTPVYAGEAWIPVTNGLSLQRAAAAALTATP